jgi:hypothetical protein
MAKSRTNRVQPEAPDRHATRDLSWVIHGCQGLLKQSSHVQIPDPGSGKLTLALHDASCIKTKSLAMLCQDMSKACPLWPRHGVYTTYFLVHFCPVTDVQLYPVCLDLTCQPQKGGPRPIAEYGKAQTALFSALASLALNVPIDQVPIAMLHLTYGWSRVSSCERLCRTAAPSSTAARVRRLSRKGLLARLPPTDLFFPLFSISRPPAYILSQQNNACASIVDFFVLKLSFNACIVTPLITLCSPSHSLFVPV